MIYTNTIRQIMLAFSAIICMWVLLILSTSCLFAQSYPTCHTNPDKAIAKLFNQRSTTEEILYIPVVFHIVHNLPVENLSNTVIIEQLNILNKDFNRENADSVNTLPVFRSVAAKGKIRFVLANNVAQSGGVVRVQTTHGAFFNDDLHKSSAGGSDPWNTDKYLNIWVANLGDGVLGYSSTPGSQLSYDGVAIHFEYFGKGQHAQQPFDLGRTLTHEIGHWLGLSHPWGNGGCESDDGIEDTPLQDSPIGGCPLDYTSCGQLAMVQNFMNLSNDACMNLFTKSQIEVMRNTVLTERTDMLITPDLVTDIQDKSEEEIIISPNPTSEYVQVMISGIQNLCTGSVQIADLFGRVCFVKKIEAGHYKHYINLPYLKEGVYTIRVNIEKKIQQERLLILHN